MITFLAICVSIVAISLTLMQTVYVCLFANSLKRSSTDAFDRKLHSTEKLPQAAIVLCLRGLDPSLKSVLLGLGEQKYSSYAVYIMVDSMDDDAVAFVRNHAPQHLKFQILEFPNKLSTCSLKCSALIHAVESIPSSIEFLAFLDADNVPDPNWLRDLIVPLLADDVGATTGNRWYWPSKWTIGTAVRQVWNSAAMVQLSLYGIAWGGSFAIKRSTLAKTDILKRWETSFCEDTLLSVELKKKNLKLVRVPDLICPNSETISLGSANRWIARQLFTVRLHHPLWPLIQLHGFSIFIASVVAPLFAVGCLSVGAFIESASLFILFGVYQFTNLILLLWIDSKVFQLATERSPFDGELKHREQANRLLAAFINQLIYPLAVWNAMRCRQLNWRGIEYSVDKNKTLRMQEYVPYKSLKSNSLNRDEERNSID